MERTYELLRASIVRLGTNDCCGGDLRDALPNNAFGHGRVDVAAAHERAAQAGAGDTTAPRLSRVRLQPAVFTAARGTTLRFTLSEPAALTLRLERRAGARFRSMPGRVTVRAREGGNAVRYRPRIAGRLPAPGVYRLTAVARDAAGHASAPARATFRVVR